ncbi:Hypothetical protein PENO1_069290 [Penicillium occitanis (nom. inval.)]|nr:Hypothetical protein PENO1_069290 [Penicillium occitanis (nom. inval.)]PCG96506.1 hypothetical protein PENOC_072520 [Penicillium occitanis (nom. inval.)]
MRFSPVFHLEDFFDRYLGISVDSSHVRLVDEVTDATNDNMSLPLSIDSHSLYNTQAMPAPSLNSSHHFQNQQFSRMSGSASHQSQFSQHTELPSSQFNTSHQSQSQQIPPALYSYNLNDSSPSYSTTQQDQQQQNSQQSPQQQMSRILPSFSPTLGLSPSAFISDTLNTITAPTPPSNFHYATFPFDTPHTAQARTPYTTGYAAQTPSGQSQASDSHATMSESGPPSEKDPFLSLLEQLAENEHLEGDGPSELDFLLGGIHAPDPNENIAPEAQATSCSVRNTIDVTCPIEDYEDSYMFANYLRQTTKSLRPSSTLRSLSSTSSSPSAPNMAASATTIPSTEPQEQNNESNESKSPPLALPPTSDSTNQKLDVNGQGTTVSLDHLGPIVVNQDGTMSRISNWDKMTEIEQKNTMRIIGKRNKQRLEALKAAGVEAGES